MIIAAYNPSTDNLEKSFLTKSYSVGVTSVTVRNNDNFTDTDRIMIGAIGNENTEIVTVSAVNADKVTLTIGATKFPHSANDPVYVLRYDSVRFYRSTTTIDGTYSSLVTVPMDVDNASLQTLYDDTTGVTTYFYKISFYHSVDLVESDMSDPIPGEGYARTQVGTLVNEFLTEVGELSQDNITVPQILGLLNECNEDIIGQSRRPYRFLRGKTTLTLTANNDRIAFPAAMLKFDRMKYNRVDGVVDNTNSLVPIVSEEEMEYYKYDSTAITATIGVGVTVAALDETDNEFVFYPTPTTTQTDKITVYYWADFDYITSLADTLQTPVKRIYKLFLLGRYYRMRAKKESSFLALSDRYLNDYSSEIVKLQRSQKVDVGTPMSLLPDTRNRRGLRRSS